MYDLILSFITAFILTYVAIPSIIFIAMKKNLVDVPDDRKSHTRVTPSLGGIGIFAGTLFAMIMWTPFEVFGDLQYILCSMLILYMIGFKDDIIPMHPIVKLLGQIFAAVILVLMAKVQLTSFYGLFGIQEISPWLGIPLSIVIVLTIVNAFNLIDGINGLSAGLTSLICLTFGYWFASVGRMELAILSFATMGSLIAFLKFNWTPAKIFMGDTGSLLCGLISSILALEFIEMHNGSYELGELAFESVPAVAIGVLIIPLFDTIRVFTKRVISGKSPLYPDKTHLHHLLLDTGLNHLQSSAVLILTNLFFIFFVYYFQFVGPLNLLIIIVLISILLMLILEYFAKKNKSIALSNI